MAIVKRAFYENYYGGEPSRYLTVPEQVSALMRIREIVIEGYGECKPRRDLLKDLEGAVAIIESQAAQ
ncbi:hypothetical protein [Pseudomonas sp. HN2-3]|uniref:hypothetical protein n=1 Tax=Pseudomonas sp. HN2-3 TaxID=2886360 RepID=UPI001D102673|nr:hypothetical protein [Pseudomonas sp. HN2-3]UDU83112.1 hypothetical protein LJX93_09275 [Pseudomonas sp. HN2-3]